MRLRLPIIVLATITLALTLRWLIRPNPTFYYLHQTPWTLIRLFRKPETYKAALKYCESEDIVPDNYKVYIHKGYPWERHVKAITHAVDLSGIRWVYEEGSNHGTHYWLEVNRWGLEAIRSDVGMDLVTCDVVVYLID